MHSTAQCVVALEQLGAMYAEELQQPFAENIAHNEAVETPLLLLSDVCQSIGLNECERQTVLGEVGHAFVEWVLDTNPAPTQMIRIPIWGTVNSDDGAVTWNELADAAMRNAAYAVAH